MRKLLFVILTLLAWPPALAANTKQLVVLVSIDGFRPDYLKRGNSPTLDGLVERGASAKGLIPAFPSVTLPNHYSMVTGLFPDHHGIVNNVMLDPTVPGPAFSPASRDALANPAWWNEGIPIWVTLRGQNKRSSTLFWWGSETPIHGIQPDDWLPYAGGMTSVERVEKLLSWLDRSEDNRSDFATLYFTEVDSYGHRYGPNAPEVGEAVRRVDDALRHFITGLERLGIRDTTNPIVVSDHGMAEVVRSQAIDLKALLSGLGTVTLQWSGPVAGFAVGPSERETALNRVVGESHMTCWPKSEIPQRLHLGSHRRVPDVVCLAQVGWTITDGRPFPLGQHGYDPTEPDMWALFIAIGPALQRASSNWSTTSTSILCYAGCSACCQRPTMRPTRSRMRSFGEGCRGGAVRL
jgi:predicted AlkP superfamily pyrophosphatase or phosphodiesterase